MKTWVDKLRDLPVDRLKNLAAQQRCNIDIYQRDLKIINDVIKEKTMVDKS